MTNEAMAAVERVEDAVSDAARFESLSATVRLDDLRALLTLARQSVGMEGLAECLKRTVHLARSYSHGTGTIFEDAMTEADRLADRAALNSTTAS